MDEEFSTTLKIPRDRIGVLIGPSGRTKKDIEKATKTRIGVDSVEGDITITASDGLQLFEAREIIRAIARGFNPDVALQLLKTDSVLEVVDVTAYAGKKKPHLLRIKGRVIGSEGKARRELEELTDTHIMIYGKTVAIIGEVEAVTHARQAIESLLKGSPHAGVYKMLEKRRRERKMSAFAGNFPSGS